MRPILASILCLFIWAENGAAQLVARQQASSCTNGQCATATGFQVLPNLGNRLRPSVQVETVRHDFLQNRPPVLISESTRDVIDVPYPVQTAGPGRDLNYVGFMPSGGVSNIRVFREERRAAGPDGTLRVYPLLRVEYVGNPPVGEITLDGQVWRRIEVGPIASPMPYVAR